MGAKKRRRRQGGLAAVLALTLLCGVVPAAAAEAVPVSVQLDGEMITFTDAEPEITNDRTFLPYRAVFEALGAEVSYEADTRTAIAQRSGIIVRVPIGATEVTVSENGVSRTLEMDVASYIKNDRTYVPVRFMAQALGCLVGWDADERTVILIDAEKLAAEVTAAQDYGYIERYYELIGGFQKGSWAVEGTMEHRVEQDGVALVTTEAFYNGLTAGQKSQMYLSMESDRSVWYQALAAAQGMSLEEYGVTEEELFALLELEMRSDAGTGENYLYLASAAGAGSGLPVETWLSMGTKAELSGVDLTGLLCVEGDTDVAAVVKRALNAMNFHDRENAMELAELEAGAVAANLSDAAFRNGEDGTYAVDWQADGVLNELTVTLDEARNAASFVLVQTTANEESAVVSRTALDAEGSLSVEMTVTAGGQTVTLYQNVFYTATEELPETEPPAEADVTVWGE